ncbi:N-acetylglucosamine-6-phosphate deacetylase [Vibrio fluvialis]|uniref:N-acetylglucosamine-6-phosphate deacetylase n=1 Tax=Vibrio fluvialis PG41 TaxID=1336752 RepID=S7JSZ2_VIBFL|nr:N-acetylglucosamine-6-phosphate deacetylase [Vibrio fluvialis]EPP25365.1 N-acetylglucosamine-6-phosphate deacetylase [Vibrio fluvialis PG41]MBY7966489.1 N-acetylglucosamine-6-phosphate deacetylase [Vibrio fluvialis]MBY8041654.1 N-acetylglucosamine-6-phosphate deacetylase [Vibrio fluvialis]MBY8049857.1 N-acetylglucosamine-6-phosphate deacetylase [Vibrio fluvialis]MCE7594294.1 N-acetylglucosamine-6-phosphate deacetylase [Vibrio fluvialis]
MALTAISAKRIFDGTHYHENAALIWEGKTIKGVVPLSELPQDIAHQHFDDSLIAPGFIDLQVNGGGDIMFNNDISPNGVDIICQAHRKHGTAYLLPTLISSTPEDITKALTAIETAINNNIPGVLGIHLEGPWLNHDKKGAHNSKLFYAPTPEQLSEFPWLSKGKILVTAAVENLSVESLQWLKGKGVTVSCGHSNAKSKQLPKEKTQLIDGFTHLYNAMSALEGREPGTVGTALMTDHAWCSIITDGIHVHPKSFLLANRIKPQGKLVIVTDAMATLGSVTNQFVLDGETIRVVDNRLVNSRGNLAGAHIGMDESVANVIQWGVEEQEALKMASTYPAQSINCDDLGFLKPGYRAAATIISSHYHSQAVLVEGKLF